MAKPFCLRGHPRTPETITPAGLCRECKRLHGLKYYAADPDKFRAEARARKKVLLSDPKARRKWLDYNRKWLAALTPEKKEQRRACGRKYRFNLTPEAYAAMLEQQNGRCRICGLIFGIENSSRPRVDHDHTCCPGRRTCGKCTRGLLCLRCNNALGWYENNLDLLQAYLDHQKSQDSQGGSK